MIEHITLIKQTDGNWKGYAYRQGELLEVRDIGPETVLQALLTHK